MSANRFRRLRPHLERLNAFLLRPWVGPLTVLGLSVLVFAPFAATPESSANDKALRAWIGFSLLLAASIMLYANSRKGRAWTWRALGVFGVVVGSGALFLAVGVNDYQILNYYFSERSRDFFRAVYWVGATLLVFGCIGYLAEEAPDTRLGCWVRRKLGQGDCVAPGARSGEGPTDVV